MAGSKPNLFLVFLILVREIFILALSLRQEKGKRIVAFVLCVYSRCCGCTTPKATVFLYGLAKTHRHLSANVSRERKQRACLIVASFVCKGLNLDTICCALDSNILVSR